MHRFPLPASVRGTFVCRFVLACCLAVLAASPLMAQSTFGAILGTVRDSSGAVIVGAQVTLVNAGTTAKRTVATDASGNFAFKNIDAGNYNLDFTSPGFEKESVAGIMLTARETRRADASSSLALSRKR